MTMHFRTRHAAFVLGFAALWVVSTAPGGEAATPLRDRSFTVVAVVDSGINPYHVDFRRAELIEHPATYVKGFPRAAARLDLSLGAPTYEAAVSQDNAWTRVRSDRLYWIPGTNIIGAIGPFGSPETFLDEDGHGTAVASLAGGTIHGPSSENVLLVVVEGSLEGLEWAADQPWIDIISNSWGALSNELERVASASRRAVENGKAVCFASGNFYAPLLWWGTQGPSWNVNVGAASAKTRGEHAYSGYPNDVLGLSNMMAATHDSIDGEDVFGGTSASTPNVCGQMATVLADVRDALGDRSEGSADGLSSGKARRGTYLRDGCLDARELEDAVQATATPARTTPPTPDDPDAIPAVPLAGFLRGGYGIVDGDTGRAARAVLLGRTPRPDRSIEDSWLEFTDAVRDSIYGPPPPTRHCR